VFSGKNTPFVERFAGGGFCIGALRAGESGRKLDLHGEFNFLKGCKSSFRKGLMSFVSIFLRSARVFEDAAEKKV